MNHNTLLKNFIKGRRLAEFENTLKDCPLSDITITLHDCIDLNNPNFPSETHAIMSSLLIHKGLDLNMPVILRYLPLLKTVTMLPAFTR
jgi:hypothetical protein